MSSLLTVVEYIPNIVTPLKTAPREGARPGTGKRRGKGGGLELRLGVREREAVYVDAKVGLRGKH